MRMRDKNKLVSRGCNNVRMKRLKTLVLSFTCCEACVQNMPSGIQRKYQFESQYFVIIEI